MYVGVYTYKRKCVSSNCIYAAFSLRSALLLLLLGHLLLPGDGGLDADAAKDEADAEPLHVREAVAEGDDGEDHGEHLARHRDGDEEDGGEGGEGVD